MKLSDFDYDLPPELIAQEPVQGSRDQSRLMVLDRKKQTIAHRRFFELPELLRPDDLLVFNDSKVVPSRLYGRKDETGGNVELLLLHPVIEDDGHEVWESMVKSRRTRKGDRLTFGGSDLHAVIQERISDETWRVEFSEQGQAFRNTLQQIGSTPIPPYIKESPLDEPQLRQKYQTVYAAHEGSAAAPTAGLHFSDHLLYKLKQKKIEQAHITLHVGLGTFAPVREESIEDHQIHAEYVILPPETASAVNMARSAGRRVVAVGTTTVRALESFMEGTQLVAGERWTDIFITPGHEFKCVDAMITNFHLPKSTLLMLVSAFSSLEFMKTAYQEAVERKYRFFSFGDAMLIE